MSVPHRAGSAPEPLLPSARAAPYPKLCKPGACGSADTPRRAVEPTGWLSGYVLSVRILRGTPKFKGHHHMNRIAMGAAERWEPAERQSDRQCREENLIACFQPALTRGEAQARAWLT